MSLGQTIHTLRTQKNMSQGDLADALNVSRQSISKWETDTSVPELDKLISLSQLFGVTLDELVTGAPAAHQPWGPEGAAPSPEAPAGEARPPHRTTGVILLCFGFLIAFLLLLLGGDFLAGLLCASPFLICGGLCFTVRKRAGLWCGWTLYLLTDLYLRYATGITWRIVWTTLVYQPEWNYIRLAVGWGQLLFLALLLLVTLRSFRGIEPPVGRRGPILIVCGWAALAGIGLLQNLLLGYLRSLPYAWELEKWFFLTRTGLDFLGTALLAALLVLTFAVLRRRKLR